MLLLTSSALFILALTDCLVYAAPTTRSFSARIPIVKRSRRPLIKRQGPQSGAIGLGDVADSSYSIQVSVGSNSVPVIFDTGSSDLWSISTDCTPATCGLTSSSQSQISLSSLKNSGTDVELDYGDSSHPTFASGTIGSDSVSVASLQLNDQFLAAVDQTNTSLSDEGLSGIFGIGFPNPLSGSIIFANLIKQTLGPAPPSGRSIDASITDAFISALPTQGPFLSRLVANGQLKQPMFTVTLEREDVEIGGNLGQLTIGELPDGVSNDSLTWVPVRLYTTDQGGLAGSTSNPNEVYPGRWEIPLDDVILNGQTLPKPTLQSGVSYTALIDSGTSFLAGPEDTVSAVYSALALSDFTSNSGQAPDISCTNPVHLSFVIGGKSFPVDPRDFLSDQKDAQDCNAGSLLPTDSPAPGALMSWILGDPFMKSNLVAFYYGNLTHPSVDPPRMGFLSTVPNNADALYAADVKSAQAAGEFVATSVAAPAATFSAVATNAQGVAQAPTEGATLHDSGHNSGALVIQTTFDVFVAAGVVVGALIL